MLMAQRNCSWLEGAALPNVRPPPQGKPESRDWSIGEYKDSVPWPELSTTLKGHPSCRGSSPMGSAKASQIRPFLYQPCSHHSKTCGCRLKRCTTSKLTFIWGKMRTSAQEIAHQIALRDYSKEAVGEDKYMRFW